MRFLTLIIFSSFLWSCSSLKIQQVSSSKVIAEQVLVYKLPKNRLNINIELTKTSFIPGPYAKYSKTYLEIEPEHIKASVQWNISKVKIKTEAVPDASQIYLLTGDINKITSSNLSQISAYNSTLFSENIIEDYVVTQNVIPYFNELGLKKIIIEDKKTAYKEVVIDSISKRIPIVNIVVRNKNKEELAKDAAKTLAKIRKRKFRLIGGLNKVIPKEAALELMIAELNKKENYYLELFLGRKETQNKSFNVSIIPDTLGKYLLFYLDNEKGFSSNKGSEIILNITGQEPLVILDINNKENQLPYRNPALVKLSVENEVDVIYQQNLKLAQFGEIKYLPLKYLIKKEITIDPESGAIIGLN